MGAQLSKSCSAKRESPTPHLAGEIVINLTISVRQAGSTEMVKMCLVLNNIYFLIKNIGNFLDELKQV